MKNSIYDFNQTLDLLGIKSSHLRKLVFHKEIPHFKVGRLLRFRENELELWIANNTEVVYDK